MLTLLLTRHGHTERSEPEQYLGQRIVAPLSDRGRAHAEALAVRLMDVPIDRVVSSPLARAAETADILARGRAAQVEMDERLAELDYGAWEGLTVEEIERRFPGEYERYDGDPATHEVGGGESGEQVAARLAPLLNDLIAWGTQEDADRTCLVVGHSSVNRVLLAVALGVSLRDYRRRFEQSWTNLTVLRWFDRQSGPRLMLANDLSHVRGLSGVTWD